MTTSSKNKNHNRRNSKKKSASVRFSANISDYTKSSFLKTQVDLSKFYIRGLTPERVRADLLTNVTLVKTACLFAMLNYYNPTSNAAKQNNICSEKFYDGKSMDDFIRDGVIRTPERQGKYSIGQVASAFPDVCLGIAVQNKMSEFRTNHCLGLHPNLMSASYRLFDSEVLKCVCALNQLMLVDVVPSAKLNLTIMKKVFSSETGDDDATEYDDYAIEWLSENKDIYNDNKRNLKRIGINTNLITKTLSSVRSARNDDQMSESENGDYEEN